MPTGEFLPSCSFKFSTSEKQNKTQQRGVSAGGGQEGSRPQWRVFTCVARPQPGAPGAEESSVRTQPLRRPQGPPLQEDSPLASGGLTPGFRRTHTPLQEDSPPFQEDSPPSPSGGPCPSTFRKCAGYIGNQTEVATATDHPQRLLHGTLTGRDFTTDLGGS